MPAEKMLTPGAVMFGFRSLVSVAGPNELKLARVSNPGFAIVEPTSVKVPPSAAIRSAPAADVDGSTSPWTPRNGIVTV